jgi:2-amino-4-hydroxy-6-hydroxymethyldihydropteridine diphosphokinase
METAYIALGSNLAGPAGTPRQTLNAAIHKLSELGAVLCQSSFYETEPVGYAEQPNFLNAAVALQTHLEPGALLERLLAIERVFGRDRSQALRNGPRTLDLDLLLYGDRVIATETLQLPHPRMTERAFVLLPLAEIAPDRIHPQFKRTVSQLKQDLSR